MISKPRRETAGSPEQLAILLLERLNAGDVSGISSLYENTCFMVQGQLASRAVSGARALFANSRHRAYQNRK